MDQTQHIPSNRKCWPWMSKCDLDPGGKGLVVVQDTSPYYNKYLCQVILNSFDNEGVTEGRTDRRSLFLYPPFFFEKVGTQRGILLSKCLIELPPPVYRLGSWWWTSVQSFKAVCQWTLKIFEVLQKLLTQVVTSTRKLGWLQ
jgi:hypothetical protein